MKKISKNQLTPPFLWLFLLLGIIILFKDKLNLNSFIQQSSKNNILNNSDNDKYINYTKLLLAINTKDTEKINQFAKSIDEQDKQDFIIIELLDNFNYDLAIKKAKKAPRTKLVNFVLGMDYFIKKDYQSAKKYLEGGNIIMRTTYILAQRELSEKYVINDDLKKYEVLLNDKKIPANLIISQMLANDDLIGLNFAYRLNNNNKKVLFNLADLLLKNKSYDNLVKYSESLNKSQLHNYVRLQIIDSIPDTKKIQRDKVLNHIDKQSIYYKFALSINNLKDKEYDQALKYIKQVKGLEKDYYYYFHYGIVLEKNKKYHQAMEKLKIATKLSNNNPDVVNYLYYVSIEQNIDLKKSLAELLKAYKKHPSGYIADSVGWAYYKLGEYEKSLPYMEKAIIKMPSDGVVNDHLGDVYFKLGRIKEAIFHWQRVIDLDSKNEYLDINKIKLKIKKHINE